MPERPWEAEFIRMWQDGASQDAIAQALNIPVGTVKSRAHALAKRELIQPRPRGGAYPHQRSQEQAQRAPGVSQETPRQEPRVSINAPGVSHQTPGVSRQVSQPVPVDVVSTPPPAASPPDMTPLLQEILQELRTLTQGLAGRVSAQTPQVLSQAPGVSGLAPQVSERVSLQPREKTERWNLHMPRDVKVRMQAKAKGLGFDPSELVAEVLRRWLEQEEQAP
jgi:hypothetical protein